MTLRALATGSLFAWASELVAAESMLPKELKDIIKKISLASAFVSDTVLDSLQLAAMARASTVTTRRITWMKNWDANPSAQAEVAAVPFKE